MTVLMTDQISDSDVEELRADFRGLLLRQGDEGYDTARTIWNAMYDSSPSLIAQCRSTADVVAAVRFASRLGLKPAVRGGGHGAPGYSVCDGLVIDLTLMGGARVDPIAKTAEVQGGAIWGVVDHETQLYGLATVGGTVSETGVGGLALGGGYGWLTRKHGLTLDNVLGVEIVTADGDVHRVDTDHEPELFWGVRGGGGNFGVVTSFTLQLHEVGPIILGGLVSWPFEQARKVLEFLRGFGPAAPEELGVHAFIGTAPEGPLFPQGKWGHRYITLMVCYNGALEEGEKLLRPLRDLGEPMVDVIGPMPYRVHQSLLDTSGPGPFGSRSYWKSGYLHDLSDEMIDTFINQVDKVTSPLTLFEISLVEGAANRVDRDATAFSNRDVRFNNVMVSCWSDAADDDEMIAAARDYFDAMTPYYSSVYSNYLGREDGARVRDAYSASGWDRLRKIKATYDPTNLFSRNQNISPE